MSVYITKKRTLEAEGHVSRRKWKDADILVYKTIKLLTSFRVTRRQEQKDAVFYVSLTVRLSITLTNEQLDAHIFKIYLLQSSTCTCFEQYLAHSQEVKSY